MSLLITGVEVVDAALAEPRKDAWVVVDGAVIREVGSSSSGMPGAPRGPS